MTQSRFIVIIRPEFMEFCEDACRAAALNHLFYRIAGKCKDQPKEKIQRCEILWYGSNELITEEMSNAWGVCKVRKEINELIGMNLFGKTSNPDWGADRTKHFFFGTEQCAKFLQLCEEHNICFVHLDLPDEVKHLIYSSNANDKSIKCTCEKPQIGIANDKSIECKSYIHQMETMDISNANDKSIEAITKNTTKINNIEDNTEGESITVPESDTPTVAPPRVGALALPSKTEEFIEKLREWRIEDEQPEEDITQAETVKVPAVSKQNTSTPTDAQAPSPQSEQAALGQCSFCPEEAELTCRVCGKHICYFEHGRRFPLSETEVEDYCLPCLEAHNAAVTKALRQKESAQQNHSAGSPCGAMVTPEAIPQVSGVPPTKGKGKKQAEPKPETPKGPPAEPASDMPWGTRKCLLWFDYWRGGILIGKFKLMQASTCAKGLAEQFSEQQVIETRTMMEADPYYIAQGGCDVCDVANNIHKYLKRKQQTKKPAQSTNVAQSQPITNIRELVRQREALRAAATIQVGV